MVKKIGLDLGYSNITLSDASYGVFREPAVALIDNNSRRIVSVGNAAIENSESFADRTTLVRPFKNGLLFDREVTLSVVKNAIGALVGDERIRCVVGVPSDMSAKQEKELFSIFADVGISDCMLVNRSVAALVGAGYSPLSSVVSVNIGASSTEIAVINEGDITYVNKAAVGGEDFDKAVKRYISEQGDVSVSLSVARSIKEKLGSVWNGKEEQSVDIEGTLALTGNKIKMTISTEDIVGVFEQPLHKLLTAVAEAIKKISLDNVERTFANGIVLTGGGAMIHGMDIMMEKILGVPVHKPADAIDSVAKGLSMINALVPVKGRAMNKNVTILLAKYYQDKK